MTDPSGYLPCGTAGDVASPNTLHSRSPPSHSPLPDKPSIAVLPFPEHERRPRAGLLCRRRSRGDHHRTCPGSIGCSHRAKLLLYLQTPSSRRQEVGRGLGVRYILEGSVRKASGRVRIIGQLIDAVTGAHIWADRFERDLTDVFALQDEVTVAVVSAIQPRLLQTEIATATRRRWEAPSRRMIIISELCRTFTCRPAKGWPRR